MHIVVLWLLLGLVAATMMIDSNEGEISPLTKLAIIPVVISGPLYFIILYFKWVLKK